MLIESRQKKNTRSFMVEDKTWKTFKDNVTDKNLSVSGVLSKFMEEVNALIKNGGGEMTFGIEGEKWFNPTTKDKIKLWENRLDELKERLKREEESQS